MSNLILPDFPVLPANLPKDWAWDQIVPPNGADIGKPIQYGYNFLMEMTNQLQVAANQLKEASEALSANKVNKLAVKTTGDVKDLIHESSGFYLIGKSVTGMPVEKAEWMARTTADGLSVQIDVWLFLQGNGYDFVQYSIFGSKGNWTAWKQRVDAIPNTEYSVAELLPAGYTDGSATYSKDSFGVVHLAGQVRKGSPIIDREIAMTLPMGFRPYQTVVRPATMCHLDGTGWGAGALSIDSVSGQVTVFHTSANIDLAVFDVSFSTAQ